MIAYIPIHVVCELCGMRFKEELRVEIDGLGRIEPDMHDMFKNGKVVKEGGCGHGPEHAYYCLLCSVQRKAGAK